MDTGQMSIDPAGQAVILQNLFEKLRAYYVFPEVANRIVEHIQKRLEEGAYAQITDGELFARTLNEHMQQVHHDKHLRVFWHPEALPDLEGSMHEDPQIVAEWREVARLNNYDLYKVERLAGNVGYLDIHGFDNPAWAGDTAAAAMNFLANTSALIVDLRKNGGGHPGMVAFISSYLFGEEPVHLNSLYWRDGDRETAQQFWTQLYVPGKRFGDKPVYVLTSKDTFSGGEEFA